MNANKDKNQTNATYPEIDAAIHEQLVSLGLTSAKNTTEGNVYVDAVGKRTLEGKAVLLISGSLPDGCSKLQSATHRIDGNTIILSLKSAKPAGAMCTQALVPFKFAYHGLSEVEIVGIQTWTAGTSNGEVTDN